VVSGLALAVQPTGVRTHFLARMVRGRSARWRRNFIRTYLERDVPQSGARVPAETLRRFRTVLAHHQGALLNASELARSLGVSVPAVTRYVDLRQT